MFKLCTLAVLITTSAFSQTPSVEKKEDPGPTFPQVKSVENNEERRIHVGLNIGINNPEGRRGATPELGLEVGYQPLIPFGLSLEVTTSRFDDEDDETYRRTAVLAKGTYNFGGETPVVRYSYLGLGAGPVFLNDGTEMGVAPLLGFDIPVHGVTDHTFTLGFVAKYLFVTSKDPDSLMTSAAVKYWF